MGSYVSYWPDFWAKEGLFATLSDGRKTAPGLTVRWNNTSKAWRRSPGPDYSFNLNLTKYGNCSHLAMLRGVTFEWFHQFHPAITFILYTSLLTWDLWRCWPKNLQFHGASFQHNLRRQDSRNSSLLHSRRVSSYRRSVAWRHWKRLCSRDYRNRGIQKVFIDIV